MTRGEPGEVSRVVLRIDRIVVEGADGAAPDAAALHRALVAAVTAELTAALGPDPRGGGNGPGAPDGIALDRIALDRVAVDAGAGPLGAGPLGAAVVGAVRAATGGWPAAGRGTAPTAAGGAR